MAATSTVSPGPIQSIKRPHLATLVDDFERHGDQLAILWDRGLRSSKISYRETARLAGRFAAELVKRDIKKGDRVLLWGDNSGEWVAAFFGCVLRGVLAVPLDVASTPDFVRRVVADVSPRLVLADSSKLAVFESHLPQLRLNDLAKSVASGSAGAVETLCDTDPLQIIFTSGTTAEPKGIVHTHRNVLASLAPIEQEMGKYLKYERLVHPIRILHTLPLSHVFGQFMGLWIPPLMAAELHFEARLVAADIAARIRRERISVLAAVPRVLDLLQAFLLGRDRHLSARLAESGGMKAWQRWWQFRDVHRLLGFKFWAFVCGGASLSASAEQFWTALGFAVIQGYGMTETTALVSLNHPFRPAQGTIGQVLPGREVKLSEQGEVLVRGETIASQTWRNGHLEEASSPWLATGDLAEFDPAGNLRFRGRQKDVIVTSSGLNIYPEDLEAALMQQRGVKAAIVIETQAEHGPEPLAVLVREPGAADPRQLVEAANGGLAEFQQIRRWLLWPEPDLPRTSTGKILRREVARHVASGEMAPAEPDAREAADPADLDSLGRVQLQARLEQQYGVVLDDSALQKVTTKDDLRELVSQASAGSAGTREPSAHFYPRWPWNPLMSAVRVAFLEVIAMPLVRLLAAPRIRSRLRHSPAKPVLLVSNHVTSYDAAFLLFALPPALRRRVAIAMSGEMLLDMRRARNQGNWFLNLLAPAAYLLITGLFNVFPLPQYSGFRRSFRHAGEAMDRGYHVLVFPEGRRSDDGTPQAFKSGSGLLWKELGSDALPLYLAGLGELKAHGGRWFRSGKVGVTVRELIPADPARPPAELTEVLWHSVFELETQTDA